MAKIPADDGGDGGSFGEELWGGGIAVEGEGWRVQSCSSINLNFNFWGSDYTCDYIYVTYIIFISIHS